MIEMNGYVSEKKSLALNNECTLMGEKETVVFCAVLSVGENAFYGYGEKSLRPDKILAVRIEEYNGEEKMRFGDKTYAITRSYERSDGLVELTGTEKVGLR